MDNFTERTSPAGLYDPRFEHDNCGIGAVVDIKGRKSHKLTTIAGISCSDISSIEEDRDGNIWVM